MGDFPRARQLRLVGMWGVHPLSVLVEFSGPVVRQPPRCLARPEQQHLDADADGLGQRPQVDGPDWAAAGSLLVDRRP